MKRKWFEFTISGTKWSTYVGDFRSFPTLEADTIEGYTDRARCICVVQAALATNRDRCEEIAWHEMKHAVCTSSGATSSLYGSSDAREERSILTVCGHEYQALKTAMGRRYLFRKPPYIAPMRDPDDE